jgi:uncharacterized protein (TIGR03382 family)
VERTLVAFTTTLLATASAHASHPRQNIAAEGAARNLEFVATRTNSMGYAFARQVVVPRTPTAAAATTDKAQSRTLYLRREGAILSPGDNNSATGTSSIVQQQTEIGGWDVDDDTWNQTVQCVSNMYSRFDVKVTDVEPADDVPHITGLIGGHPNDVGLDSNVAGVSPFTTDCSTIENSIVFTFTDVLPDDPQLVCEVMSQELAHSFGLDHEMLASDPMTYLDYDGPRTFKDTMASCGEFGDRQCGINGSVCRSRQNSVSLLESRLGRRGAEGDSSGPLTTTTGPEDSGCAASGSGAPLSAGLVVLGLFVRRRRATRP